MLLFLRSGGQELRVETDLLDVAEHEECVFHFTTFNNLFEILVFDKILVDQFLCLSEWNPNNEVSFQRQFCHLQSPASGLSTHELEDIIFGSSQEVTLIHLSYLFAKVIGSGFFLW